MLHTQRKWGAANMLAACGVVPFAGGCGTASAPAAGGGDSPLIVRVAEQHVAG